MPPQGEPRRRSVGRRYSSFVTLHRRVGAASQPLGVLRAGVCACHALTGRLLRRLMHPLAQLREELGPALLRGLDPPPRRSLAGVNRR